MKKHHYEIKTSWTGNLGNGTKNYRAYERDHEISAAHKTSTILGSSDPSFRGDSKRYNPEELFIASISSCHMLWYLHLCSTHEISVLAYVDTATGSMIETKNGSGKFEEVILYPEVVIRNKDQIKLATELHHKAHEFCFIANSCNFEINHRPKITVQQ